MRNAVAVAVELRSAGNDRLLHGVLRPHVDVAARSRDIDDGGAAALDVDIAFGNRVLHRVVGLKEQRWFCRPSKSGRADRSGHSSNTACRGTFWMTPLVPVMAAADVAGGDNVNVGLQLQLILLGVVEGALGRAGGLLGRKLHQLVGLGYAGLLIEGERLRDQVERVLQLLGRGLVGLAADLRRFPADRCAPRPRP